MKSHELILSLFFFPFFLFAQEDSTISKIFEKKNADSLKNKLIIKLSLPPRTLIIKMKDLKEIKDLKNPPFLVIDDTASYTPEELASGMSEKELANYKKNKDAIKKLFASPIPEEETYPAVSTIRKILGIAKTAAVILILILSLL